MHLYGAAIKEEVVGHLRLSKERHALLPLLLAALIAAVAAPAASAAPNKPYEVTLLPAQVTAGVTVADYGIRLTNRAGTQQLGSADVTAPTSLTVVGNPTLDRPGAVTRAGNVLLLRNLSLPPGESVTVTVAVRMTCVSGTYSWTFQAKQSNDFSGTPGNDLGPVLGSRTTQVTGSCALRFATHPARTEKNELIRGEEFQPAGPPVTVEAVDGRSPAEAQRLTWFTGAIDLELLRGTYSGNLNPNPDPVAAIEGLATFPTLKVDASGVYVLRAETTAMNDGVTFGDSRSFVIVDIADECNTQSCSAQIGGRQTTTNVSGGLGTSTGLVLLSLNLGPPPSCAGYTPPTPDWYEFELTAERDKTIVVTYDKQAVRMVGSPSSLEICFAAPQPFDGKDGPAVPFDYDGDPANGLEGFVGLLPDCPAIGPCVLKKSGTSGGGATVTFFVPAAWGDPRFH